MLSLNFKKTKNYVCFLINSVLLGYISINIHRNYISEKSMSVDLFTTPRIILFIGLTISYFIVFMIFAMGEKKNSIEEAFLKIATHPLTIAVLLIICFRLWYFTNYKPFIIYYDTKTYTIYPYNILQGQTDIFRTPVYPFFLKLISFLTGYDGGSNGFYTMVVQAQRILSFSSAVLIYFSLAKFLNSKYICALAALIYGCSPAIISWDLCILTESISLFSVVLFIYILFSFIKKPTVVSGSVLSIYAFIMIMVRPTFVYLFAILGVFYLARLLFSKTTRKQCIAAILALVVSGGLLAGYCGLNKKNYGYFGISSVSSTVNNLCMVMQNGMVHNEDYPELTEYIERAMANPDNVNYITDIIEIVPLDFTYSDIASYVNDCISKNRGKFYEYTWNKAKSLVNEKIATQYAVCADTRQDFKEINEGIMWTLFPFSFFGCFIIVVLGVLWTILMMIIKKRICWQIIGMSALVFTHIFVSIYGSMAEFSRLSVMVIPAVFVMVFYLPDYIFGAIKARKILNLRDEDSEKIVIK